MANLLISQSLLTEKRNPKTQNGIKWAITALMVMVLLNNLGGAGADPDLWGYLAFGRLFWETPEFPYRDIFAYVPTLDPWIYHEWLTGVLFSPIYQALGAPGLQFLKYGFGLGAAVLVYLTARLRGAGPLSAGLVLVMVQLFTNMGYSPVRAQIFTYAFFALSLYGLERARLTGNWRGLWLLAALQILWCNLHGGFLAGLGLIALYALGEALGRRPWLPFGALLIAATLVTLINPYGLEYWSYIFRAVSMPRPEITEWASMLTAYRRGLIGEGEVLYLFIIITFTGMLAWWARWREITPILVLAVTLFLGVKHIRHQVFFLLGVGAYVPRLFAAFLEKFKGEIPVFPGLKPLRRCFPFLAAAVLAGLCLQFAGKAPFSLEIPAYPKSNGHRTYYPVGAAAYILEHGLSGSLLVDFNWGEYAIWTLYPRCRVAIDGRYETVYPDPVCRAYFDFLYARLDWRRFLEEFPPDLVLIDPRSPVYSLLSGDSAWRQVYADTGCALFVPGQ